VKPGRDGSGTRHRFPKRPSIGFRERSRQGRPRRRSIENAAREFIGLALETPKAEVRPLGHVQALDELLEALNDPRPRSGLIRGRIGRIGRELGGR